MDNTAYLILENGTVFEGKHFGACEEVTGEVVFATGMTGYLETLTDQSYHGQIVLQTFPLIGNYGVIPPDFESAGIGAKAYIVKYPCRHPSNFRSEKSLDEFLRENKVTGLHGIDTRALTKIIRENGVMNGKITKHPPTDADREEAKRYTIENAVANVSGRTIAKIGNGKRRVALLDFGAKHGIANSLAACGCEVQTFSQDTPAQKILDFAPSGIMLSNGPGDPANKANAGIVENVRKLMHSGVPIFGICLGHQLLALANGYKTQKMKFGHRGANQPVKELSSGRVFITSQNHGYAVLANNSSFINVNDGSCEGLDYGTSFSVQFHPEACGGPLDTKFLFDRFMERIDSCGVR